MPNQLLLDEPSSQFGTSVVIPSILRLDVQRSLAINLHIYLGHTQSIAYQTSNGA